MALRRIMEVEGEAVDCKVPTVEMEATAAEAGAQVEVARRAPAVATGAQMARTVQMVPVEPAVQTPAEAEAEEVFNQTTDRAARVVRASSLSRLLSERSHPQRAELIRPRETMMYGRSPLVAHLPLSVLPTALQIRQLHQPIAPG